MARHGRGATRGIQMVSVSIGLEQAHPQEAIQQHSRIDFTGAAHMAHAAGRLTGCHLLCSSNMPL
jgi:hypothetical protein